MQPTWTFNSDSKLLRYYIWCWDASSYQITFCRMFWGILFSPFAVVFQSGKRVLIFCVEHLPEPKEKPYQPPLTPEQRSALLQADEEKKKAKELKWEESRMNKLLTSIETWGTKHGRTLMLIGQGCLVLLGIAVVGVVTTLLIIPNWEVVLIGLGCLLVGGGLIFGIFLAVVWVIEGDAGALELLDRRENLVEKQPSALEQRVEGIALSIENFFRFMFLGAKNVKKRTCPLIKVVDVSSHGNSQQGESKAAPLSVAK